MRIASAMIAMCRDRGRDGRGAAGHLPYQQSHAEDQQGETDGLGIRVITSQFVEHRGTLA